jgi:hypothetical protein
VRRRFSVAQALVGPHGARHALAIADAALAAHLDLKDALTGRLVFHDRDVAVLKIVRHGLVGPKTRVGHEQHVIVNLLRVPRMAV